MTISVNTRHFKGTKVPGQAKWLVESGRTKRIAQHGEVVKRLTPKKEREADEQQPRR